MILQRQVSYFLFVLAALVQISLPIADQALHRAADRAELAFSHGGSSSVAIKEDGSSGTLPDDHEHECPICQAMLHGSGTALIPEQIAFAPVPQILSAALISRPAVSIGTRPETAARPRAPPILT